MTTDDRQQVAGLVNSYSPITRKVSLDEITWNRYSYLKRDGVIAACIKTTPLSWYQVEVTHLVVHPDYRRQGLGREILESALQRARTEGSKLAQCTIREDNQSSSKLFEQVGFKSSLAFVGLSGNKVVVWQKAL